MTATGAIFRRTTTDPAVANAWTLIDGCARDIGVGGTSGSGHVWVIGCGTRGDGSQIWKWDGSTWIGNKGNANKITVGPDGKPWVLTASGRFFRYSTSNPTGGTWELLPGTSTDLAINQGNYLWSIGAVSSGQENLAVWDEQTMLGTAPAKKEWVQGKRMGVGGPNCALAVGANGRPFMVDNTGVIFHVRGWRAVITAPGRGAGGGACLRRRRVRWSRRDSAAPATRSRWRSGSRRWCTAPMIGASCSRSTTWTCAP